MAVVALVVLISMGRPVLFRQHRAGLGNRPFELVKFRSMRDDRDASGALLPDAARTTRVGAMLRATRLDELPELWNILRGDMAFVGPRPLLPQTLAEFGADGLVRSSVRPGITGLAQVSGNTLLGIGDKLAIDLLYVRNRSLGLDLRIIFRTPLMMLRGERIDPVFLEKAHASDSRRCG
jgi:lipopolysaccharide/colanic/teichoic acid biosynthesis glycosyltransferase